MTKTRGKKRITVSQHFKLGKIQHDLDFCDTYIDYDTALFIDPWAIRCGDDEFSVSAYQKLQSVFELLIDHIHHKRRDQALELLDNLHEPSETGLGYSRRGKNGSAVGREKSIWIYNALVRSKAVRNNRLTDLEDTALHIEKIARDNISDIVTNIIREDLIKYTQEQCDLYGIEMIVGTTKVFWDDRARDFIQKNEERLLQINGKKILLVPKHVLRRNISINYTDFYNRGILEYEQARHYDARTSLCRTLKGKIVGKPYKKTLKKLPALALSRDLVFEYIDKKPEILLAYKLKKSEENMVRVGNKDILDKQRRKANLAQSVEKKIVRFSEIPAGKSHANEYHDHIIDCLNTIFNEPKSANYLSAPKKEAPMNLGRKKIDIRYHNSSDKGFFSRLRNYKELFCAKILFECKNYRHDLANPEYDQMIGRFNNRESTIGYIVCRTIEDEVKATETCKDYAINGRGYISVLTDKDIIALLNATLDENKDILIDELLQRKMDEIASR